MGTWISLDREGETLPEPLTVLRDIIENGVVPDLYRAEQARAFHHQIGQYADPINDARFGDLFGAVQDMSVRQVTLSLTKLYEAPNERYPTRSLPAAFDLLRREAPKLPLRDSFQVGLQLENMGLASSFDLIGEPAQVSLAIAGILGEACPSVDRAKSCATSLALASLKTNRDKAIAHNEALPFDQLPKANWGEVDALIRFAQGAVSVIGMGYWSMSYSDDEGRYLLSTDATRASRAIRRLLQDAQVLQSVHHAM